MTTYNKERKMDQIEKVIYQVRRIIEEEELDELQMIALLGVFASKLSKEYKDLLVQRL